MSKDYSVLRSLKDYTRKLHRQIFDKGYEQGVEDTKEKAYEQGLNDAWMCVRKLMRGLNYDERNEIFECTDQATLIGLYSASEVIAKIKAWEEEQTKDNCKECPYNDDKPHAECVLCDKQTEDKIKVGDEVKNKWGTTGVVIEVAPQHDSSVIYSVLWENKERRCLEKSDWNSYDVYKKTGKHYPQIEEVLRQMRG